MRKILLVLLISMGLLALFLSVNVSTANASLVNGTETITPTTTGTSTPTAPTTQSVDPTIAALEQQKLQNENNWWWINGSSILTVLFSSICSMIGVVLAVWVGFRQWSGQQKADREKRHQDHVLEQQKLDEARFQSVVKGFESDRPEARVGAAILLLNFLGDGYARFYSQVFYLSVSILRVRNTDPTTPEPIDALSQALVTVFRQSFSLARGNDIDAFDPFALDATNIQLDNAYLSQTDLRKIYLRKAYLRNTYFWDSQLQEAYFKHSNMAGAYLRSANLEGADLGKTILTGANLSKTKLKGAHFRYADLTDADFTGADLTDTRIESASSLQGTILRDVTGLSAEQKSACVAKGAIVDEVEHNSVDSD